MQELQENLKKKKPTPFSTAEFGKVPPQAKELEAAVLGAIMLERDAYDIVAEILKPECFYMEAHQTVYKCMRSLAAKNSPIDLLTVSQELMSKGQLEALGGPYFLTQLQNGVFSSANIGSHAKVIYQKYHLREIIRISGELLQMAYDDSMDNFELQDYAEKIINDLGMNQINGGMVHIQKVMVDAVQKIEEWRKIDGPITGIPSGFNELDKATRGWQPGDLIILAARPSVGKTAFALNLIRNAASNSLQPVTVGVWSLEMKAVYLALRMLSAESKTLLHRLQTGRITDEEMQDLMKNSVKTLSNLSIFFEENSNITMLSLARKARRLKKKEGLGLIVIDYLQLMSGESNKGGNREQEIAKISRGLKNLAQELEIPIIALSQLNRTDGGKNVSWEYGPSIGSIRESGAVEQDADVIMMLWGPSDEDKAKDPTLTGKRKVRIGKARNGVLKTEELNFKNEIQLFEKIEELFPSQPGNWKAVKDLPVQQSFYETESDDDAPF